MLTACLSSTSGTIKSIQNSHLLEEPLILPSFNHYLLNDIKNLIQPEEIFSLNNQQKNIFFTYFNNPKFKSIEPYERVANYLSLVLDDFNYTTETLTAEQTLDTMSGNCLSLAILTTSLANLANVSINYHLMEDNPLFTLDKNLLVTSDHIRTVLRGDWQIDDTASFKTRKKIRIDFFPTDGLKYRENISAKLFNSMYYSNKAVESSLNKDYSLAFQYANKALELSKNNLSALNTMGVLHRRKNDDTTAEQIYHYGISTHPNKVIFLKNYLVLLEEKNRHSEANVVLQKILMTNDNNPWQWIRIGQLAERRGDYLKAIDYYNKALNISPKLHRVHLFIANNYYRANNHGKAMTHLKHAIAISDSDTNKSKYQFKLARLQQL